MDLKNQINIVTGGGQGIGRGFALGWAQEGAVVVIRDINEKGSHETAAMIPRNDGPKAVVIPTDITYEDQVARLIYGTMDIDKRIDILVNNCGIMGPVKNKYVASGAFVFFLAPSLAGR